MEFKNQKELFEYIWKTRPHVSEISGDPLYPKGHSLWHWQFLHVLSKQAYPSFKLNPDNIMLATYGEHLKQEEFEVFRNRKEELKRIYYKQIYNKQF